MSHVCDIEEESAVRREEVPDSRNYNTRVAAESQAGRGFRPSQAEHAD